jgi:hypothetical protein
MVSVTADRIMYVVVCISKQTELISTGSRAVTIKLFKGHSGDEDDSDKGDNILLAIPKHQVDWAARVSLKGNNSLNKS